MIRGSGVAASMRKDSLAFALSGTLFGLIVGWIIGTQQAATSLRPAAPAAPAAQPANAAEPRATAPVALDEARVKELTTAATARPADAAVRVQLANLYFDAERFPDAIEWYRQALAIQPKDANVSTDLAVSYYYSNQSDKALEQFEYSLEVDPKHTKTLLNQGIVRAFGKQDLDGAARAWQQVLDIAPDSPEGRAARQALDALRSAHPAVGAAPSGGAPGT